MSSKTQPSKAGHNDKRKTRFIINKEAFERVNFLYQAAHLAVAQDPKNIELSRFYSSTAKMITEKLVLKINPQVKKTLCKCCRILLIPGITAKFRIKGRRQKHMVTTCLTCGTLKRQLLKNDDLTEESKDDAKQEGCKAET